MSTPSDETPRADGAPEQQGQQDASYPASAPEAAGTGDTRAAAEPAAFAGDVSTPAFGAEEKKPAKARWRKRTIAIVSICGVVLLGGGFAGGYFTGQATATPSMGDFQQGGFPGGDGTMPTDGSFPDGGQGGPGQGGTDDGSGSTDDGSTDSDAS